MQKNRLRALPLLLFALLLPAMALRDFTPSNELRYLSIADEALADGNFFAFTNQGEPYADKPPLYLWIVMAGRVLLGEGCMWFLALFSFVPALVILRTMDRWTAPRLDEPTRFTGALMLMSCGLFLGLAVFLRMDMLMCMFITLALHTFWQMYRCDERPCRRRQALFAAYVFLALFTKGPVGLLLPLVATVAFLAAKRQLRTLGRYWGWTAWAVLLGGCALWFTAVRLEGGAEYLDNLLFHQTLDRAVDAFHHKEPFYYYLISMWWSLAPWSLLVIGLIAAALIRRERLADHEQFFLTVILSTLGMLSLFSSKLAVYLAPAFPFFIYLGVSLLARTRKNGWLTAAVALPALVWCAALPAVAVLSGKAELAFLRDGRLIAAAAILTLSGCTTLWLARRKPTLHGAIDTLAGGLLLALFVGGFALPRLNDRIGYGPLCRTAQTAAMQLPSGTACEYFVWRMHRPESMDVYLGRDVTEVTAEEILAGRCAGGILMLPARKLHDAPELERFLAGRESHPVGEHLAIRL